MLRPVEIVDAEPLQVDRAARSGRIGRPGSCAPTGPVAHSGVAGSPRAGCGRPGTVAAPSPPPHVSAADFGSHTPPSIRRRPYARRHTACRRLVISKTACLHLQLPTLRNVLIGGFTAEGGGSATGVRSLLNTAGGTGTVTLDERPTLAMSSPTYLVGHPAGPWAFAVSEGEFEHAERACRDRLGRQAHACCPPCATGGDGACHLAFSADSRFVLVAHYTLRLDRQLRDRRGRHAQRTDRPPPVRGLRTRTPSGRSRRTPTRSSSTARSCWSATSAPTSFTGSDSTRPSGTLSQRRRPDSSCPPAPAHGTWCSSTTSSSWPAS